MHLPAPERGAALVKSPEKAALGITRQPSPVSPVSTAALCARHSAPPKQAGCLEKIPGHDPTGRA